MLKDKVAIVTGGNSGIGMAIVLALAEQGANIVIDYVTHPEATEELEQTVPRPRRSGHRCGGGRQQGRRPADARRHGRQDLRPARHHGQQRRRRDPHLRARHDRGAVREGARHQPEERVLRHPDRGQADDRPRRRRADHQHHLGPRRLAHARQHPVLPVEGWDADADPHRRCRAGAARGAGRSASVRARWTRRSTPRRKPTRRR